MHLSGSAWSSLRYVRAALCDRPSSIWRFSVQERGGHRGPPVQSLLSRGCGHQLLGIADWHRERDLSARSAAKRAACVIDADHASAIVKHRPAAVARSGVRRQLIRIAEAARLVILRAFFAAYYS